MTSQNRPSGWSREGIWGRRGSWAGTGSTNRGSYNMGEMRHILKTKRLDAIFQTCHQSLSDLLPQRSHNTKRWRTPAGFTAEQGWHTESDRRGDKCKVQSSVLYTWKLCRVKSSSSASYFLISAPTSWVKYVFISLYLLQHDVLSVYRAVDSGSQSWRVPHENHAQPAPTGTCHTSSLSTYLSIFTSTIYTLSVGVLGRLVLIN